MKTQYTVAFAIVPGFGLGAVAIESLHAQAKPPVYYIAEVDVTNQEGYMKEQADNVARVLAERLQAALGQPVLVENRPGAGSMIGTEFVAKAAPDGHTLLFALWSPMTIAPTLYAERLRTKPAR